MPIKVMIPTALRQFAGGQNTIMLEGATVGEVLGRLNEQCPELKRHLYADDGSLRNFVNVFVNDANIRDRENQDTPIADGDELSIVPSIAGGTGSRVLTHPFRGVRPGSGGRTGHASGVA